MRLQAPEDGLAFRGFQLEFRPSPDVLTKAPNDKMNKADHKKKALSPPHVKWPATCT